MQKRLHHDDFTLPRKTGSSSLVRYASAARHELASADCFWFLAWKLAEGSAGAAFKGAFLTSSLWGGIIAGRSRK